MKSLFLPALAAVVVLSAAPARAVELQVVASERKTTDRLILRGHLKEAHVWTTLIAPKGKHIELFEVLADARQWQRTDAPVRLDLALEQDGKKLRPFAELTEAGFYEDTGTLLKLDPRKAWDGSATRARVRFACLVNDGASVSLKAGNEPLALPPPSPGELVAQKYTLKLAVLDQETASSFETEIRHGPDIEDNMPARYTLAGRRLRKITLQCDLAMDEDPYRGSARIYRVADLAMRTKDGRAIYPLGNQEKTMGGGRRVSSLGGAFALPPTKTNHRTTLELIFEDSPDLDGATPIHVPSTFGYTVWK